MQSFTSKVEITAPVGSWESLSAAIRSGADSVYFGIGILNMRARSSINFTLRDLVKIAGICRKNNVQSYLTLNTVIYDGEMKDMQKIVNSAKKNGITAIIASDQAVIQYAVSIGMPVHMSTQTNISNRAAVKYYSQFADVMVTARELDLAQVKAITKAIKKEKIKDLPDNWSKLRSLLTERFAWPYRGNVTSALTTITLLLIGEHVISFAAGLIK